MDGNKPVTVNQFNQFAEDLVGNLNKVHTHTCNRLDDIEQRLEKMEQKLGSVDQKLGSVEANLKYVKRDTTIIPDIFELLHTDGEDIAKLNTRVSYLEK